MSANSTRVPTGSAAARVEAEEGRLVGDARRLLHVVGDDHDREAAFEAVHQVLDRGGRDRVERRGGLVEQQHVGFDRDRARDAEPLLLAAGEAEGAVLEPVLDLVPERRSAQRPLDPLVEVVPAGRGCAAPRRRCRRSTSGTGSVSGRPCRSAAAPRPGRRRRRRGPGRGRGSGRRAGSPATGSFIRLRQRMKVDLPQPEGPISAVIRLRGMRRLTPLSACLLP